MSYVCSDCGNVFLQPPKCTTCGAEKLYDHTVRSQAETIEQLRMKLQWQPIESAPRDGKPMLISDGEGLAITYFNTPFDSFVQVLFLGKEVKEATHWMPLPEPPK